jgi:uncharacterized protein YegP (UPF0339 family)
MFKNSFRYASLAAMSLCMVACAAQTDDAQNDTSSAQEDLSSKAHFETFEGANGLFYFRLRAGNGQIQLASEGYSSVASVLAVIADAQSAGRSTTNYDVFRASNGEYGVNLLDWNGGHVAKGQLYSTKSSATRAVNSMATTLSHKVTIVSK